MLHSSWVSHTCVIFLPPIIFTLLDKFVSLKKSLLCLWTLKVSSSFFLVEMDVESLTC